VSVLICAEFISWFLGFIISAIKTFPCVYTASFFYFVQFVVPFFVRLPNIYFVLCPYYFADMSYVMHAAMICSFDKKEHGFLSTYVLGNTLSFTGLIQQGHLHHYYPVYLDSLLRL